MKAEIEETVKKLNSLEAEKIEKLEKLISEILWQECLMLSISNDDIWH